MHQSLGIYFLIVGLKITYFEGLHFIIYEIYLHFAQWEFSNIYFNLNFFYIVKIIIGSNYTYNLDHSLNIVQKSALSL